jgi:pantothenate synthetase
MSSRNVLLSPAQRDRSLGLSRALAVAGDGEGAMRQVLEAHELDVDYAVIRDASTLEPPAPGSTGPRRAVIAARLDAVRLIDNDAC